MSNENVEIIDGIEVDTTKAQRMIKKLIIKEKRNISTKEKSNPEMIKAIKQMIEEDVECYWKECILIILDSFSVIRL